MLANQYHDPRGYTAAFPNESELSKQYIRIQLNQQYFHFELEIWKILSAWALEPVWRDPLSLELTDNEIGYTTNPSDPR